MRPHRDNEDDIPAISQEDKFERTSSNFFRVSDDCFGTRKESVTAMSTLKVDCAQSRRGFQCVSCNFTRTAGLSAW